MERGLKNIFTLYKIQHLRDFGAICQDDAFVNECRSAEGNAPPGIHLLDHLTHPRPLADLSAPDAKAPDTVVKNRIEDLVASFETGPIR